MEMKKGIQAIVRFVWVQSRCLGLQSLLSSQAKSFYSFSIQHYSRDDGDGSMNDRVMPRSSAFALRVKKFLDRYQCVAYIIFIGVSYRYITITNNNNNNNNNKAAQSIVDSYSTTLICNRSFSWTV
jgi:hypothetical protein